MLLLARDLAPQEQALQQQRQFVNQLAHELNTPLAIVNGSLRQLGKKLLKFGDGSKERLRQAQQETSRLVRLLRHLLVLTDLETGRRQLQLQPLALKPWLQEWMAQQGLPFSTQLNLVSDTGEGAMVATDAKALAEVLDQLLDNSLRYSEGPAQIELKLLELDGAIGLRWRDQGLGITAEPRSQVFERFVRLEEHRDFDLADGAGLGLALCEALMQAMGGRIELEPNTNPTIGVAFLLWWPQVLGR